MPFAQVRWLSSLRPRRRVLRLSLSTWCRLEASRAAGLVQGNPTCGGDAGVSRQKCPQEPPRSMNTVRVFTWLLLTPSLLCNTGCRPSEEPPGSRTETAIESASGAAESTAAHVVAQDANDPRGNVPDPPRDLSRLTVTVGDGTLLVTDPEGRRTGINPATGEEVREIPRSVFYRDAIDNDVTGEPATASTFFVDIEQPLQGTYEVLVTGLTGGVRTLLVSAISTDNKLQPLASVPVELSPGSTATFEVEFASFPGAIPRIKARVILVDIDIKPGSDPNSMDPDNLDAVITVAILTDQSFDATTVDQTTVRFGKMGTEAVKVHGNAHEQDVDKDGDTDLVFHFRFGDTGLACGDTEAKLTGETSAGTPIEGKDAIRTVGC